MPSIYERIIRQFDEHECAYSEKEHTNEGYGTNVASIHGVEEKYGAKALVLSLSYAQGKTGPKNCLAILSFPDRLNSNKIKTHFKAQKVSMTPKEESQKITECESGAVPPFSFDENIPVIIDEKIKKFPLIFFNVGRLDRSVRINISDYLKIIENNNLYQFNNISNTTPPTASLNVTTPVETKYQEIIESNQKAEIEPQPENAHKIIFK